jgi:hypothetical protein
MNALPGLRFRLVDVFVDYRQRQDPHVHANGPPEGPLPTTPGCPVRLPARAKTLRGSILCVLPDCIPDVPAPW